MNQKDLNKALQEAMNVAGESLTADGVLGPVSTAAMEKFDLTAIGVKRKPVVAPVIPDPTDYFGAPWIGGHLHMLNHTENDPALVALLAPNWKNLDGCEKIKDLSGKDHAWCANDVDFDFRLLNIQTPNSGLASSFDHWGDACPFWFGAILPIRHDSGGRHVNRFLYWIDIDKMIAATLDGNRGNKYAVNRTDLSGKNGADQVKTTPRWPKGYASGQFVTMSQVLAKYPQLKVGGSGSSTT